MKATIAYTDGFINDERVIYEILSELNIDILTSYYTWTMTPQIVISVESPEDIRHILYILNRNTYYGVSLVNLKPTIKELMQNLFRKDSH